MVWLYFGANSWNKETKRMRCSCFSLFFPACAFFTAAGLAKPGAWEQLFVAALRVISRLSQVPSSPEPSTTSLKPSEFQPLCPTSTKNLFMTIVTSNHVFGFFVTNNVWENSTKRPAAKTQQFPKGKRHHQIRSISQLRTAGDGKHQDFLLLLRLNLFWCPGLTLPLLTIPGSRFSVSRFGDSHCWQTESAYPGSRSVVGGYHHRRHLPCL